MASVQSRKPWVFPSWPLLKVMFFSTFYSMCIAFRGYPWSWFFTGTHILTQLANYKECVKNKYVFINHINIMFQEDCKNNLWPKIGENNQIVRYVPTAKPLIKRRQSLQTTDRAKYQPMSKIFCQELAPHLQSLYSTSHHSWSKQIHLLPVC